MKYIPGFRFTVGDVPNQGGSMMKHQAMINKVRGMCDDLFKYGNTYAILNITPQGDNVVYTYKCGDVKFQIEYDDISEAEARISKLIGR